LTLEQSAVQPIVSIKGTAAAEAQVGGPFVSLLQVLI